MADSAYVETEVVVGDGCGTRLRVCRDADEVPMLQLEEFTGGKWSVVQAMTIPNSIIEHLGGAITKWLTLDHERV